MWYLYQYNSVNITRMEFKEPQPLPFISFLCGVNITRMEFKVIFLLPFLNICIPCKYNQNGI